MSGALAKWESDGLKIRLSLVQIQHVPFKIVLNYI